MIKAVPRLFLPILVTLAFAAIAGAQGFDRESREAMQREITQSLLEKDIGELAKELARERPTRVATLLKQLMVFARAGHRERVRQTLQRLANASDMPPVSHRWDLADSIKRIIGVDDVAAMKIYYELVNPNDLNAGDYLLPLWAKEGDAKEIDPWLAERVKQNFEWMRLRISWRAKLGTAGELLDEIAGQIKANPRDRSRVLLYLQASQETGNAKRNLSWLIDVLNPQTAYEFYELGTWLENSSPDTALSLYQRSLEQLFTATDMRLINERVLRQYSMAPPVKSWEKQLRFWTKLRLAELYKKLGQSQAAQMLVEELEANKDPDIMHDDIYNLAGAVQASSGLRVVEARILQKEATEQNSASYWAERARYYMGRGETDAVMETYRSAFSRLPFKPQDETSLRERLKLLKEFTNFAADRDDSDSSSRARRREVEQLLWREFNSVPPETNYAFGVAEIISDNEYDFEELTDSLFISQINVLARMLAPRRIWKNYEQNLIDRIVCRSTVSPEQRAVVWNQLEALTKSGSPSRAFYLADSMISCQGASRAIPLLISYLDQVRKVGDETDDASEWNATDALLRAYLYSGDWRSAEKLVMANKDSRPNQLIYDLTQISVIAARSGAVEDAVRVWRIKSNLDRRYLESLEQLAATPAKEPLRGFYIQMKKQDPNSAVPDVALQIIK